MASYAMDSSHGSPVNSFFDQGEFVHLPTCMQFSSDFFPGPLGGEISPLSFNVMVKSFGGG